MATDLDGTLLRSDGSLDARTLRALQRVEAAPTRPLVVLCTARPARWLAPLAAAAGRHGLVVCANGGVIWSVHDERVLEQFPLEVEVAHEVVVRLRAVLPDGAWAVERAQTFAREPDYTPRWPVPDDTVVDAIDALLSRPPVKLMLRHPHLTVADLAARAREQVGHLVEVTYSSSEDALLEISALGVSKASALAGVCAARGHRPRGGDRLRRHAQRPADARLGRPRGGRRQRASRGARRRRRGHGGQRRLRGGAGARAAARRRLILPRTRRPTHPRWSPDAAALELGTIGLQSFPS